MSTIAHVFEAAGIATVAISLIRGQAETVKPPRALHCNFPLGRPLGKPNDPEFQRSVITAAFDLLTEPTGPVLRDFPQSIEDQSSQPLVCPIPPLEGEQHLAVKEALGLRKAYDRALAKNGRTLVGRATDADGIPAAIEAFLRVAEGTPWKKAGLEGHPLMLARDITSYFEEAASALVDHIPAARSAETWFFQSTEAGAVLKAARRQIKEEGDAFWFYVIPFTQKAD